MAANLSYREYLEQTDRLAKENLGAFAQCAYPMARALAWADAVIDQGSTETPQEYLRRVATRIAANADEEIGGEGQADYVPLGVFGALRASLREGR